MVSFDVVLLFTLIPVHRAIENTRNSLEKDDDDVTVNEICKLLENRINVTFLFYKGVYFNKHETAMGSQVSVSIEKLVMENVEVRAISSYDFPPKIWKRYVDDVCTALKKDQL